MYQSSYSKEQNAQFTAEFSAITNAFKDAQLAALEPGSDEVQALVAEHRQDGPYQVASVHAWRGEADEAFLTSTVREVLPLVYDQLVRISKVRHRRTL